MEVTCKTNDTLPLEALSTFQGSLKQRTDADLDKIERSIEKHGFSFPFFVWAHDGINSCLDGHGRLAVLQRMVARGESVPELPVVYIDCKDEADAKERLLKLNSHYGQMTAESVLDFIDGLDIDISDLELPAGALDLEINEEPEAAGDPEINTESDFNYQQQYGVIVMCKDEAEQKSVYDRLNAEGFECKVVAV